MAKFANIADEIIKQSLLREQTGRDIAEKAKSPAFLSVKKIVPPPVAEPDYSPAIQMIVGGLSKGASDIVSAVDEWAADQERLDLLKKVYGEKIDYVPAKDEEGNVIPGEFIPSLTSERPDLTKEGGLISQIQNRLSYIGAKRNILKTSDDPKEKAAAKGELRAAKRKLEGLKRQLNEVAPGKSDLKAFYSAKDGDAGFRLPGKERAAAPKQMKPALTLQQNKENWQTTLKGERAQGVPINAAETFAGRLLNASRVFTTKDVSTEETPGTEEEATARSIQANDRIMQEGMKVVNLAKKLNDKDISGYTEAVVRSEAEKIAASSEPKAAKAFKLFGKAVDRSYLLDKDKAGDYLLSAFADQVLSELNFQPADFTTSGAAENFFSQAPDAIKDSMPSEGKEKFIENAPDAGVKIITSYIDKAKDMGYEAGYFSEMRGLTGKVKGDPEGFRNGMSTFLAADKTFMSALPSKSSEARNVLMTRPEKRNDSQKIIYEAMMLLGKTENLFPVGANQKQKEKILLRLDWPAWRGTYDRKKRSPIEEGERAVKINPAAARAQFLESLK